jgi:hypothetical protein
LPRPGGGGRAPASAGAGADFFRIGADFFARLDFRRFGVFGASAILPMP